MTFLRHSRRGALIAAAVAAAVSAFVMSAAPADAQYYRRGYGYNRGAAVGLGIAGGLIAGGLAAGALARPVPDVVEAPVAPACWFERRRVWDDYNGMYVVRRVRVCE
ncbi:hypothetical protein [Terrarubrum flagellatum]|uniref:hypothetical protein n=1 Tax=Terrirubrum flagellatum TaxID=2895980 RepID=UPI0031450CA3